MWDVSFLFLLGSTVLISLFAGFNMWLIFFAIFLVVMWHCLLLCNYKMLLKHKVGCFFSLDSTVLISIYSLDSTCFSLLHIFLLLRGIVCCCVTTRCY